MPASFDRNLNFTISTVVYQGENLRKQIQRFPGGERYNLVISWYLIFQARTNDGKRLAL
jgi:hypothetical protein